MKCGIAIFPSKKLQDIANSYRMRYDSHYTLIPPHITLKEPFKTSDENLTSIINEVHEIAKQTKPFFIKVNKVRTFHPLNNTIYLGIEENEALNTLQNRLNSNNLNQEQKYKFVPHITIGQELSDGELFDVVGRLKMEDINHEEIIDRIQLLYQLDNDSWTVYETFHLGKDC
ncbi:YjcG family protein [Anaerobacillus sp. MEB173]|uniref:YjcG family protein n=1 Tax=Anaerobacillus sp. MEB173 TaxID=3383345 RepID=UPI003F93C556